MFDPIPPLAAFSDLGEALVTVCVGFTFVLVVLLILTGATTLIGKIAARPAPTPRPEQKTAETGETASESAAPQPSPATSGIDPKVLAAISAAIRYAVGKRPHRVLAIRTSSPGWAQEGRRQIFSSHRLR